MQARSSELGLSTTSMLALSRGEEASQQTNMPGTTWSNWTVTRLAILATERPAILKLFLSCAARWEARTSLDRCGSRGSGWTQGRLLRYKRERCRRTRPTRMDTSSDDSEGNRQEAATVTLFCSMLTWTPNVTPGLITNTTGRSSLSGVKETNEWVSIMQSTQRKTPITWQKSWFLVTLTKVQFCHP